MSNGAGGSGEQSHEGSQDPPQQRMQDFIFARELAEVYLLLDHLSGRSNKSLTNAIGDGEDAAGKEWIKKICLIAWPPDVPSSAAQRAEQAADLLLAKDKLNSAAKPANGASIAFTLLVAGDDDAAAVRRERWRAAVGRSSLWARLLQRPASSQSAGAPLPGGGGGGGGGGPPPPAAGAWSGGPPSRVSLARQAYPGLVSTAARFNWQIKAIIVLLFVWLIFTCGLSWNIAAGQAILARLDGIEATRLTIQKKIADSEIEDVKRSIPDATSPNPQTAGTAAPVAAKKLPVQRYCDRARILPPLEKNGVQIAQFDDVTQRQICDQVDELRVTYGNAREDLADWLAPWGWLKGASRLICGGRCLADGSIRVPPQAANEQLWAAVLLQVLAVAVLPLCYGFLGAGAAVVRNIWGKMRDSLLSPRDLTLSLGQLALGAVIGACIGLFVTPTGANAQGVTGLTAAVTLTPSALSFIAGFGVEGVFVALESFIKRVFNIPDPKP